MVNLYEGGAYLINGTDLIPESADALAAVESKTGIKTSKEEAIEKFLKNFFLANFNCVMTNQIRVNRNKSHFFKN